VNAPTPLVASRALTDREARVLAVLPTEAWLSVIDVARKARLRVVDPSGEAHDVLTELHRMGMVRRRMAMWQRVTKEET
jgi:hypothetical protein